MEDTPPKSLVYLGTPSEAVPPLRALHDAGYPIELVVTRADARRGRRGRATPSPVKEAAIELGVPVSHELSDIERTTAELGVVVAYGRIIPADLLQRIPMINIHFSRLPRWRGAAPVERALLEGDVETAVGIMAMEAGLDTGPLFAETIVAIESTDTTSSLKERLVSVGTSLLLETLADGLVAEPVPQVGEPLYASKISSEDRRIDWNDPIKLTDARIRVGRAHTTLRGERFIIWSATTTADIDGRGDVDPQPGRLFGDGKRPLVEAPDGSLELIEVQPAGKPRMQARAWWNGAQPEGEVLGGVHVDA